MQGICQRLTHVARKNSLQLVASVKVLLALFLLQSMPVFAEGGGGPGGDFEYPQPPGIPASISAPANAEGNWTVSWSAATNSPTYYQLEESALGGTWGKVYEGGALSFVVANKAVSGSYQYRARACNDVGCGGYSVVRTVQYTRIYSASISAPSSSYTGNYNVTWSSASDFNLPGSLYSTVALEERVNGGAWQTIQSGTVVPMSVAIQNRPTATYSYRLVISNTYFSGGYGGGYEPDIGEAYVVTSVEAPITVNVELPPAAVATPEIDYKSSIADTSYTVKWNASATASSYHLYRRSAAYGGSYGGWSLIYNDAGRSHAQNYGDGHYQYKVEACNATCGLFSGVQTTTVLLPPGKINSISIIDKDNNIDGAFSVSWGGTNGRVTRYELTRETAAYGGSFSNRETLYPGGARSMGQNFGDGHYRYFAEACNEAGCGAASAWATTTVLAVPSIPNTPTAPVKDDPNSDGITSFHVYWGSGGGLVERYHVYRRQEAYGSDLFSGQWQEIISPTTATSVHQDLGIGSYEYKIVSYNSSGYSADSAYLHIDVLTPPDVPGAMAATDVSHGNRDVDGAYTVHWGAAGGHVENYELWYRSIDYGNPNFEDNWSTISSPGLSEAWNGLADGHYQYKTRACNSSGCSVFTAIQQLDVLFVPNVPSQISGPSSSDGRFTLDISYQNGGVISSYKLQHSVDGGATWTDQESGSGAPATLSLTRPAYSASGELQTHYQFRIAACNLSGCSPYSAASNTVIVNPPGTPQNFGLTGVSHGTMDADGSYQLSWSAVVGSGIIYRVEERVAPAEWEILSAAQSDTNFDVNGRDQNTYNYRVFACIPGVGCGDSTNEVTVSVAFEPAVPAMPSMSSSNSGNQANSSIDGSISVAWLAPAGTITAYNVYQNGNLIGDSVNGLAYSASSLLDGNHGIQVQACNQIVCSPLSPNLAITVLHSPSAPGAISGPDTDITGAGFTLQWVAASNSVDFYQYQVNSQGWLDNGTATNVAQSGLADGSYNYQVRACNSLSCGEPTAEKTVTVYNPPGMPGSIQGPAVSNTGNYELSWAPASGNISQYILEHAIAEQVWVSSTDKSLLTVISDNSDPKANFRLHHASCGINACSQSSVSINSNSYDIYYGDVNGDGIEDVYFKVKDNVVNQGDGSNTAAVSYLIQSSPVSNGDINTDYAYATPEVNASVDTAVLAQLPEAIKGEFKLSWSTGGSVPLAGLALQNQETTFNWQQLQSSTATTVTEVNKDSGEYRYRVKACNNGACSAYTADKAISVNRYHIASALAPEIANDPQLSAAQIGDHIGSIAGSFRVSESGASTYNIAIATAAGTAGVVPQLSLGYSSQAGNGLAGVGWNLGGLSAVSRCRQTLAIDGEAKPLTWGVEDRFCLDGQRLLVDAGNTYGAPGSTYKTEIDSFSRVTAVDGSDGKPDYFKVERKDGSTSYYGQSSDAKQQLGGNTLTWAISRFEDSVGNPISFHYSQDADGHRLDSIGYAYGDSTTPAATVELSYEPRSDKKSGYVAGYQYSSGVRLTKVSSLNGGQLLREYRLQYNQAHNGYSNVSSNDGFSRVTSLTECTQGEICLPPTHFDWDLKPAIGFGAQSSLEDLQTYHKRHVIAIKPADINGDSHMDVIWVDVWQNTGDQKFKGYNVYYVPSDDTDTLNRNHYQVVGITSPKTKDLYGNTQLIDYNGDGKQDVLLHNGAQWVLLLGSETGLTQELISLPFTDQDTQFGDINSDGLVDAINGTSYYLLQPDPNSSKEYLPYHFVAGSFSVDYASLGLTYTTNNSVTIERPAGDLDGDGQVDFWVEAQANTSFGDNEDTSTITKYQRLVVIRKTATGFELQAYNDSAITGLADLSQFADFNGDGLSDLLRFQENIGWQVMINKGNGFAAASATVISAGDKEAAAKLGLQILDYNQDGHADLVWRHSDQLRHRLWNPVTAEFEAEQSFVSVEIDSNNSLMDHNNDGAIDIVTIGSDSFKRRLGVDTQSNLVVSIENGLGAVTEVSYEPLNRSEHYTRMAATTENGCNYRCAVANPFARQTLNHSLQQAQVFSPVMELNGPMYVTTQVRSSAPAESQLDAKSSISYHYKEAKIQAGGRGMLGFRELTTVDDQTGIATSTEYRQDWPFIGHPISTTVRKVKDTGAILSQATNTWALKNYQANWPELARTQGSKTLAALKPYIQQSLEQSYDYDSGLELQNVVTTNQYDDYGNPTNIKVVTSGNGDTFSKETINNYHAAGYTAADSARLGRLAATEVITIRDAQGRNEQQSRNSSFSYITGGNLKGLLETETIEPNGDAAKETLHSIHRYDQFGNKVQVKTTGHDGNGIVERVGGESVYDTRGRYVERSYQNFAGLPGNPKLMVSAVLARNHYGAATQVKQFIHKDQTDSVSSNRGVVAYSYYSPMGRKYFSTSQIGGWSQQTLAANDANYCPQGTVYMALAKAADGSQSKQCFDVLGRSIRKLALNFEGQWAASDVVYDKLGRVVQKSEPYVMGSSNTAGSFVTSISYDTLGRVTHSTMPDGSSAEMQYNGYSTVAINDKGHRKTELKNALGELISVTDNLNGSIAYDYDVNGNLIQMSDPGGNTTYIEYDKLGRKTTMRDPDKGDWFYRYNGFGELIYQRDAKLQTSAMVYDLQGRMLMRDDRKANGVQENLTQWQYDSAENGLGQLAGVGDLAGFAQSAAYDHFGRAFLSQTLLPGLAKTFTTYQTYDQLGRVFQAFDAASGQQQNGHRGIQNVYNQYGHLQAINDARQHDTSQGQGGETYGVYRTILDVDARGNVTGEAFGNGALTSRFYNDASGRLEKILSAIMVTGERIQDLRYEWDSIGNLSFRHELSSGKDLRETFLYDGLNRLTESKIIGGKTQSLSYDALGNITSKSDVGSYSYGVNAGPHAVTEAGDTSYIYDANGNNTSSTGGTNRTIDYSTFDKAVKISKDGHSTEFAYGPSRSRYKRVDTSADGKVTTTYYIGNVEYIQRANGASEYKRQIAGVAVETLRYDSEGNLDTSSTSYLHKDHLGSIDVITDEYGTVSQSMSFDAWGLRRDAQSWTDYSVSQLIQEFGVQSNLGFGPTTTRGYTGHEMLDEVGIVHMNGRIYDARLGRFLQADPFVQSPSNTQSLNRYSYIINNPLNATDPSGFFWSKLSAIVGFSLGGPFWAAGAYLFSEHVTIPLLRNLAKVPVLNAIVQVVGCVIANGACPVFLAAYNAAQTSAVGGSFGDGLKAAAIAYVAGSIGNAIGEAFPVLNGAGQLANPQNLLPNALLHGLNGGVVSVLQGGKFGHGFASAFGSGLLKPLIGKVGRNQVWGRAARTTIAGMLGGSISSATGGKFANGAITAAVQWTLNAEGKKEVAYEAESELSEKISEAGSKLKSLRGGVNFSGGDLEGEDLAIYIYKTKSGYELSRYVPFDTEGGYFIKPGAGGFTGDSAALSVDEVKTISAIVVNSQSRNPQDLNHNHKNYFLRFSKSINGPVFVSLGNSKSNHFRRAWWKYGANGSCVSVGFRGAGKC